jgi:hypothetical protein
MQKATSGAGLFANAMNVDLGAVYGIGHAGGGGGGGRMQPGGLQVNVTFTGDNYGFTSDVLYNQLRPVMDRVLQNYQYQMTLYTRSNPYAFTRGLS